MATSARSGRREARTTQDRAQPPIRWPHPDRSSLALVGVWAIGLVIALLLPALIVSPTAKNPPHGQVLLAFGCTLVGAAVMVGSSAVLRRRKDDVSMLLMGAIPALSVVIGGVILAASKIAPT